MYGHRSISESLARSILIGAILSVFVGVGQPVAAQEDGYSTPNPDWPPFLAPDIESRSHDPDRPPAYGPEDAKVRVILFSDYQCPSCRRISPATQQISSEFPGDVRIEVWQRPLAMHAAAQIAAAAAIAAQQQGKFWEMHDLIINNRGPLNITKLEQFAADLDLDLDQFRAAMNDPAVEERIRDENATAEALGAIRTPGWVINGKVSEGWGSWRGFRQKVERELTAANVLAEAGMDPMKIQVQRAEVNFNDPDKFELYRKRVLLAQGDAEGE